MTTAIRLSIAALRRMAFACMLGSAAQAVAQNPAPLALPDIKLLSGGSADVAVRQPDGGTIVSGMFGSVNGTVRNDLVRLRADGTVDPDWDPPLNGFVQAIAVDAAGDVYVGGYFSGPNDMPRANLAKLSGSGTGAIDPVWNPSATGSVDQIALDGAGSVYVAGQSLTQAGGLPNPGIAKLSASGTGAADPNWNLDGPPNRRVLTLAAQPGALYVGGEFTEIGGRPRRFLAKLSSAGSIDAAWNPQPDSDVLALATFGGAVYAAGYFNEIGGWTLPGLARLNGAGAVDTSWLPLSSAVGDARTLAIDPAGSLFASGVFYPNNGTDYRSMIKIALADGAIDRHWNPRVSWDVDTIAAGSGGPVAIGGRFDRLGDAQRLGLALVKADDAAPLPATNIESSATVEAIAGQPNGGTILSGWFHQANGSPRPYLLRIAADGTLDANWNPMPDGRVTALAVGHDGAVFVGGHFQQIGGESRRYLAKLDGGGTGSIDASWNVSIDSPAYALSIDTTGQSLYVGGSFRQVGVLDRKGLVRIATGGSGSVDATWNPTIDGNAGVETLTLGVDASIYVGGYFDPAGGIAGAGPIKISTTGTGTVVADWNPAITGSVRALTLDAAGRVYIGGHLLRDGGTTIPSLTRLHANGERDATWQPLAEPSVAGLVYALRLDDAGGLYVGGSFRRNGAAGDESLRRFFVAGAGRADARWKPAPNWSTQALAFDTNGALLAGGSFTTMGGAAREGIAALPRSDTFFADGFDAER